MKSVTAFDWSEETVAHIARHHVTPDEVESLCFAEDAVIERGRGDDIYYITGQTESGRYLFVVVRYLGRGRARAITARDMEKKERTRYQKGR